MNHQDQEVEAHFQLDQFHLVCNLIECKLGDYSQN